MKFLCITYTLLLILFFSQETNAQPDQKLKIDSLLKEVENTKSIKTKLSIYELFMKNNYSYSNEIEKFRKIKERASKLALKENDSIALFNINYYFSHNLLINSYLKESKLGFENCLTIAKAKNIYTLYVKAYQGLGKYYLYNGEFEQSINFFHRAINYNQKAKLSTVSAEIYNLLGCAYGHNKNNALAYIYFQEALKLRLENNDYEKAATLYINLAVILTFENNIEKATMYYQKSLEQFEKVKKEPSALLYFNTGYNFYSFDKNYKKALSYFIKAEERLLDNDLSVTSSIINIPIAECYLRLNKPTKSIEYYKKVLTKNKNKTFKDIETTAFAKIGIANCEYILFNKIYDQNYFNQIVKSVKKNEDVKVRTLWDISDYFLNSNQTNEAINYLIKAYKIDEKKILSNNKLKTLAKLSNAYNKINDYKQAYKYANERNLLKDSIEVESDKKFVETQEMLEDFMKQKHEKDKSIAAQEIIIANQKAELLKRQNIIIIVFGILLLMLLGFLFYYFKLRFKQRIREREVENQLEINRIESIIEGEEKEKKQIAAYIHEKLNQDIISAKNELSFLNSSKNYSEENIRDIVQRLKQSIRSLNDISYRLSPPALDFMNITDVLESYCEETSITSGKRIKFAHEGEIITIDKNKQLAIYRVVQELLGHIIEYTESDFIFLKISNFNGCLALKIEDEKGNYPASINENNLWRNRIHYRLSLLNAEHNILTEDNFHFHMRFSA